MLSIVSEGTDKRVQLYTGPTCFATSTPPVNRCHGGSGQTRPGSQGSAHSERRARSCSIDAVIATEQHRSVMTGLRDHTADALSTLWTLPPTEEPPGTTRSTVLRRPWVKATAELSARQTRGEATDLFEVVCVRSASAHPADQSERSPGVHAAAGEGAEVSKPALMQKLFQRSGVAP